MRVLIVQRGSLSSKVFVPSRSVFNRVLEPLEYLASKNNKVKLTIKTPDELQHDHSLNYDIAVFCKHNTQQTVDIAQKLQSKNVKIVYDLDDLIYKFTEDSIAYDQMQQVPFLKIHLEQADFVIFSNEAISEIVKNDFSIKDSAIIKTGINVDKYQNKNYENIPNRVLLTNGDNIKVEHFRKGFNQVFNNFLIANKSIQFDVFGDTEEYLKSFERYNFLGSLPWDEHKYYLMKNRYKFAIVPLGSNEESETHQKFSICKTPIKFLEYGALRIPAIYSDAKIYRDVVKNSETGLLVTNEQHDWSLALNELNKNQQLRNKITENAFDDVYSNHHIRIAANQWFESLQKFI
jgi:glycosyltransferase involved in cell wall biosynthesis